MSDSYFIYDFPPRKSIYQNIKGKQVIRKVLFTGLIHHFKHHPNNKAQNDKADKPTISISHAPTIIHSIHPI